MQALAEEPTIYVRLPSTQANDFSEWANSVALKEDTKLPDYAERQEGRVIHKDSGVVLVDREGTMGYRTGNWSGSELFGVYATGGDAKDGYRNFKIVPLDVYNRYSRDRHEEQLQASPWRPPTRDSHANTVEALTEFMEAKTRLIEAYEATGDWKFEKGAWRSTKDNLVHVPYWNGKKWTYYPTRQGYYYYRGSE